MPILDEEFLELTKDLDIAAFWDENARCRVPTTAKPRCELHLVPDDHWLLEFSAVPSTVRYYRDKPYRDLLHRDANALLTRYVGRAFFDEDTWEHQPRRIENLFGSEFQYTEGGTPWLGHVTDNADAFGRILDRAEATDMQQWALPPAYIAEWEARRTAGKPLPRLGVGSRGPATIMTSVLSFETVMFWLHDRPNLMLRFRDVLAAKMIELNRVLRAFSGNTTPGWNIADDNCALFSPALYREFCAPVLQRVMDALAPSGARRYQHSDSAMGHLLDQQRALGIAGVNYGPEVDVALIRRQMPEAIIHGHMPPFLLRNGSAEQIRQRTIDDFVKAGAEGRLIVTTAGSLAAGTGLGRMRWHMQVVQDCCRYKP
ncbi:MAG: uroporphyrinogen decarboxylase family protein [Lentisphaerae bacterium]|nr:uroporphyrinogen decarboxylase family protein [Lentisphaerota bacterium]